MKRLVIFLIVTFGLSWGVWIPAGIVLGTFEQGIDSSNVMIALVAIGMFFPALGALVAHFASKPEERIDLCIRPRIGENVPLYLVAWLVPAVLSALGGALFFALNPQLFDPTMMAYMESIAESTGVSFEKITATMPATPIAFAAIVANVVLFAPFINMIPAFGEELGWRGMLLPTLCERMSQRAAVLVSGVIWGIWHAPIIIMGHNYGMDYPGFPVAGVLVMILACTTIGSFISYLRLKSQSVWPCALAHGAINASANISVLFCTAGLTLFGPNVLGLEAGIPLFVLGVICWLRLPSQSSKNGN